MVFPKKWANKLPDDYENAAQSFSNDEIKEKIFKCEETLMQIEKTMDEDTKLASLKESVKDISGDYRSSMNCEKAKIKYLLYLMSERGLI